MAIDRCNNCDVNYDRDYHTECPKCSETISQYLDRQFMGASNGGVRLDSRQLEPAGSDLGDLVDGVLTGGILGGETKR
jgi:hypothetical protein